LKKEKDVEEPEVEEDGKEAPPNEKPAEFGKRSGCEGTEIPETGASEGGEVTSKG